MIKPIADKLKIPKGAGTVKLSFQFYKVRTMQRRHLSERLCRNDTEETKAQQNRAFPCATMAHILSYGFSVPCKRQALIFSLPSYPHQARFYRYVLICFIDSFIWLCLTSFTAVPLICGLTFLYQVSAVSFAWLCGGDWLYYLLNYIFS